MTFAPKFAWFFMRFNRGIPDGHISFWKPDTQNNRQHFGVDLDASEDPVLSMIASPKSSAGWLTTKRFVWDGAEGRQQFWLDQITGLDIKILGRPEVPSDNLDLYEFGLWIKLADGRNYDIRMPNIGVLNGFLSIFAQWAQE
ncbi:MAG: hypothetical protein ACLPX9_15635 [Rhodomicrobium sp.]